MTVVKSTHIRELNFNFNFNFLTFLCEFLLGDLQRVLLEVLGGELGDLLDLVVNWNSRRFNFNFGCDCDVITRKFLHRRMSFFVGENSFGDKRVKFVTAWYSLDADVFKCLGGSLAEDSQCSVSVNHHERSRSSHCRRRGLNV